MLFMDAQVDCFDDKKYVIMYIRGIRVKKKNES